MVPMNDLSRLGLDLAQPIRAAVERVIASAYYVLGPENEQFEHDFAAFLGVVGAVGVGNGTDALELALRALGVGPGDEVLTVANAGMYSTTAINAVGASPRYVDVGSADLLIDPDQVLAATSPNTRAAIITHLYGRMADVGRVSDILQPRGISIIEDCAQAHGASLGGRRAGSWGDLAAFSFYPTKNLGALGDGGAVAVRQDSNVLAKVRSLRQYGWSKKYHVEQRGGRNSRLDEIQAAVLATKLPLLDDWNTRRRAIAQAYHQGLAGLNWKLGPVPDDSDVCHLFVVRVPDRDRVQAALRAAGISSDVHYPVPDHRQSIASTSRTELPVTELAADTVLSLPCFPQLTDAEVSMVIDSCQRLFR